MKKRVLFCACLGKMMKLNDSVRRRLLTLVLCVLFFLLHCLLFGPSRVNKAYIIVYPMFALYYLIIFSYLHFYNVYLVTHCKIFFTGLILSFSVSSLMGLGIYLYMDIHKILRGVLDIKLLDFLGCVFLVPYFICGGFMGFFLIAIVSYACRSKGKAF